MSRQPLYLFLSAVGWAGFIVVTLWTVLFLAGVVVPRTVDGPARTNAAIAVTVDLALLLAVRRAALGDGAPRVKAWLRRRIPASLERTSYVLATDICLVLLLVLWQPWGGQVWHVHGTASGRPLVAVRGRLAAGDHGDVRGRPPRAHRASSGWVGGPSRVRHDQRAGGRRTARHRATPTDDRTGPGLLGDPAHGRVAPALRCRLDRVHRRRNQVRGARPTAHVRRRVRRLRRPRPGPAAQTPCRTRRRRSARRPTRQLGQAVRPDQSGKCRLYVAPTLTAAQCGDVQNALDTFMRGVGGENFRSVHLQRLGPEGVATAERESAYFFADSSWRPRNSGEGSEPRTDPRGGPLRINCMTRRQPTPGHAPPIR